jgi:ABC-type glycerol-3-phosphate transport system substrate-binding protein
MLLRSLHHFTKADPSNRSPSWRTITGLMLSERVYVARNWTYSLGLMYSANRDREFEVGPGLGLDDESDPSNLLGGDFLAVPVGRRYNELTIELIRYLLSKEVQSRIAGRILWPIMRGDVRARDHRWHARYDETIERALAYARPTPNCWSTDLAKVYGKLFDAIVGEEQSPVDGDGLQRFQEEITKALFAAPASARCDPNRTP